MSKEKNVYIALFLSFFFICSGNIYNGLLKRGAIQVIIALLLASIFPNTPSILGIWIIYVTYDTYTQNKAIKKRNKNTHYYNNTGQDNFNNQNNNNTQDYNNSNNNQNNNNTTPYNSNNFNNDTKPENNNIKKIDINTAGINEIKNLPGIGLISAKKLIQMRENGNYVESMSDLGNKLNLKPYQIEQLKPYIIISENRNKVRYSRKVDL